MNPTTQLVEAIEQQLMQAMASTIKMVENGASERGVQLEVDANKSAILRAMADAIDTQIGEDEPVTHTAGDAKRSIIPHGRNELRAHMRTFTAALRGGS